MENSLLASSPLFTRKLGHLICRRC